MTKINIGDIFGDYKVLSRNYDKKAAAAYWDCECIRCQTKKILRSDSLKRKPSCNCKETLINQVFNCYKVIEKTNQRSTDKCVIYKCQCIYCGKIDFIASNVLRSNRKVCSCSRKTTLINMEGQHFGFLKVLYRDNSPEHIGHENDSYWICQCENCGSVKSIRGISLRNGTTISCGCIKSKGEIKIAQLLTENNIPFQREYTFKDCKGKYKNAFRFDFAIFNQNGQLSHLVEYDGIQHFQSKDIAPGWNTKEHLLKTKERDQIKNNYCKEHNIKLIRIKYDEEITLNKIMGVIQCN